MGKDESPSRKPPLPPSEMGRSAVGWSFLLLLLVGMASAATDPGDVAVLRAFEKGLKNRSLLKWPPDSDDPCGPPRWPNVYCSGSRVSQIQVQNFGLEGPLPPNFNSLTELENIGLQRNRFSGALPSFAGLSKLRYAYLGSNNFDSMPADFFHGLASLQELSLEHNPLNGSSGWNLPVSIANDTPQLQKLFLTQCNLIGQVSDALGSLPSLSTLELAYNSLSGAFPASFTGSQLRILVLNNQYGDGLSGTLDVFATMISLEQLWLHGNQFAGVIPAAFANCVSLKDLKLNGNKLVGPIPPALGSMPNLQRLTVDNNMLTGPIPAFKFPDFAYDGNSFCRDSPGSACTVEVTALLDFLGSVNYPAMLASGWKGNDPCARDWLGVSCNADQKVSVLNLQNRNLNGRISPSLANLTSLTFILLGGNNLVGSIPPQLTGLKLLRTLNVSSNNLQPPVPAFSKEVAVLIDGNPRLSTTNGSANESPPNSGGLPATPSSRPPSSGNLPPSSGNSPSSSRNSPPSSGNSPPSSGNSPSSSRISPPSSGSLSPPPVNLPPSSGNSRPTAGSSPTLSSRSSSGKQTNGGGNSTGMSWNPTKKMVAIFVPVAALAVLLSCTIPIVVFCVMKKKQVQPPRTVVIHPRDPSDPDNVVKIAIADDSEVGGSALSVNGSHGKNGDAQLIESGSFLISVQVLRSVTRDFAPENELGRGGFGVVYKGLLDDGTTIAVKRMEAAAISNKALDEFRSEISVLSKVRHRHLVSLMGYCVEGNERLLVYEYMPQGALSKHIFQWQKLNLQPLTWKKRLNIALDVARGMEYLHNLAHHSFIHRDLKSSNILLGDDFRAKVADFGLVKLAPDGKGSIATRLAGTFGYLAPEYAVTGKITTKADVFSFGVVLMELVTGLMALDEDRSEESRHLVSWFWQMKSGQEAPLAAIDPALDVTEDGIKSISTVAELAMHCTSREPNLRPDMSHAVNVLSPLVEKWKPADEEEDESEGITYDKSLLQMVKIWKATEGAAAENSLTASDDSRGSIPARPTGFAESFTSADGR